MLAALFTDEALTACFQAAQRILDRFGEPNQNGETTYSSGDLRFARTNGNAVEIRFVGVVGLRVPVDPYPGHEKQVVWTPGDWVQAVDAIDQGV